MKNCRFHDQIKIDPDSKSLTCRYSIERIKDTFCKTGNIWTFECEKILSFVILLSNRIRSKSTNRRATSYLYNHLRSSKVRDEEVIHICLVFKMKTDLIDQHRLLQTVTIIWALWHQSKFMTIFWVQLKIMITRLYLIQSIMKPSTKKA
jgi:hypothetical protein